MWVYPIGETDPAQLICFASPATVISRSTVQRSSALLRDTDGVSV